MLSLYASFSTLAVEYVPNCKSINPLVTSQWCNNNCNHIPAFCPANLCLCNTGRCFHSTATGVNKCYEACDVMGQMFEIAGINATGRCASQFNVFEKTTWEYQCPDGVTNTKYCATKASGGPPLNITIATKGIAR